MGLPVPCEYPLTPIVYFDGAQPPFIPMVPVLPSVQAIVPSVAAAVANEAASKAMANYARMFCYNLMAQYGWQNATYPEIVKLVCDYIARNLARGIARSPEMAIPEAVQTVLSLYTSTLLLQYPELKAFVDQRVIQAAFENAPYLEDLKKEIADMYHHHPGNGMPGNGYPDPNYGHVPVGAYAHAPMGHGHPGPGHLPAHYQGHQPMQHGRPVGYPPHGGMHPGHMHPHAGHPSQHVGHGSGFGHHGGRTMSVGAALTHAGSVQATQASSDRFASRPNRGVVQHQQHVPAPAPATEKNAIAEATGELIIAEGSEMDRAAHQLAYFGAAYQQDLRPRAQRFQQSATAMSGANVEQPQQHVYKTWLMCSTLDDAITLGRSRQYETQQVNSRQDIYRCFAIVAKPIVSVEDIDSVMKRLLEANSFKGLATKIRSTALALEQSKGEMTVEDPDAVVSFLTTVDNRMTKLVNEFLQINVGLKGVKIDSFTEDILGNEKQPPLLEYLDGKKIPGLTAAYLEFEKDVFSVLGGEEFDKDALADAYESLEIPAGLKYTAIPENYSITFVFMNSREMGWTVGAAPVRVNKRTAPTLHKVIESLDSHKRGMGLPTLNDVIVTSDGATYRVYRDYLRAGEYLISTMA